jgi:hypothetical protein
MNKLKFAHIADLHLGSYRDSYLRNLNFLSFEKTISIILKEDIDFLIIAGDIFNTAIPSIDLVSKFIIQINRVRERGIPIYFIGGSHDYSDLGKSYLDILEVSGVMKNVFDYDLNLDKYILKPIINENLKIQICGVVGKKQELEKKIYQNLEIKNLKEGYFKIFLFHTSLNDFKPKFLDSVDFKINTSLFPKGFDYYAGGHIHKHMVGDLNGSKISYSGPLFPNNFKEIRDEKPSFNICEWDFEKKKLDIKKQELNLYNIIYEKIEFDLKSPKEINSMILDRFSNLNVDGKIILLELVGYVDGKIKDIDISKIISFLKEKGADIVLRNTYKLISKKEEILEDINVNRSIEEIEEEILTKNLGDYKDYIYLKKVKDLLELNLSKKEEEKKREFEERISFILDKHFMKN